MSLHCLALLGNKNEPLYICASDLNENNNDNDNDKDNAPSSSLKEDVFGFFEDDDVNASEQEQEEPAVGKSGFIKRPASIRHEVSVFPYFLSRTSKLSLHNNF